MEKSDLKINALERLDKDLITPNDHDTQENFELRRRSFKAYGHALLHWTVCFDDNCLTHRSSKKGNGWFPRQSGRKNFRFQTRENPIDRMPTKFFDDDSEYPLTWRETKKYIRMPIDCRPQILNIMLIKNLMGESNNELTILILSQHKPCIIYLFLKKNDMISRIDETTNTIKIYFSWENVEETIMCKVLENYTHLYMFLGQEQLLQRLFDSDRTLQRVSIVLESSPSPITFG